MSLKDRLIIAVKIIIIYLIVLWLIKFLFLLYFPLNQNFKMSDFLLAFVIGLRFDFATIFMINTLWFLFLLIRWPSEKPVKIIIGFSFITFSIVLLINLADFFFYPYVKHKFGSEILIFFRNFSEIIIMILKGYWYALIIFFVALFILYKIYYRVIGQSILFQVNKNLSWTTMILSSIVLILSSITIIRGGFQIRPLQLMNAYQGNLIYWGDFSIPGAYSGLTSLYFQENLAIPVANFKSKLPTIRKFIRHENDKFLDVNFPFLRKFSPPKKLKKKYNVMIISLESWSRTELAYWGNEMGNTKFFDSIIPKGMLFTNFYSTGQRSITAVPSIASSIIQTNGRSYTMASYQSNRQRSLPQIFNELDYNTIFIHGSKAGTMTFSTYATQIGFKDVIYKEKFDDISDKTDGAWGVLDEYVVDRLNQSILKTIKKGKNFFSYYVTIHPHGPYNVPTKYNYYKKGIPRYRFLNALRYADNNLKKIISESKRLGYFDNTIFVFTVDHAFRQRYGRDMFNTPLLLYAPKIIKPGTSNILGSHADILPTLIDLLAIETTHASMGKSLFRKEKKSNRVLVDFGTYMGFFNNKYMITTTLEKITGLFNYNKDIYFSKNLLTKKNYSGIHKKLKQELDLYLSAINYAKGNNKIAQ